MAGKTFSQLRLTKLYDSNKQPIIKNGIGFGTERTWTVWQCGQAANTGGHGTRPLIGLRAVWQELLVVGRQCADSDRAPSIST